MANKMKKLAAMLVAVAMVLTLFPSSVFAADEHADEVHVIVENTTYAKTAGAPWEGRAVDTWVKINADSTGISVLKEVPVEMAEILLSVIIRQAGCIFLMIQWQTLVLTDVR